MSTSRSLAPPGRVLRYELGVHSSSPLLLGGLRRAHYANLGTNVTPRDRHAIASLQENRRQVLVREKEDNATCCHAPTPERRGELFAVVGVVHLRAKGIDGMAYVGARSLSRCNAVG